MPEKLIIDTPKTDPDSINGRNTSLFSCVRWCQKNEKFICWFSWFSPCARIYRRSPLPQHLNEKYGQYFLLGDSAYRFFGYLVVLFKDNYNLSQRQWLFNQKLTKTRYIIENCFGILKQKFLQLCHCKLRIIPDVNFIWAYCILHNLAIDHHFVYE